MSAGTSRIVAMALASLLVLGSPSWASAQAPGSTGVGVTSLTSIGQATVDELVSCLQQRPNLAVAIVVDESGSLKRTDPDDKRAAILAGFLRRLLDIAVAGFEDRDRQVLVTVGYFGGGIEETVPWTSLTPDSDGSAALIDRVRTETEARDDDDRTDFRAALRWARDRIRAVEARADASTLCTMTLWFSDGELDPDNRPAAPYERESVAAATAELCDSGGILDAHRRAGSALVGIFLFDEQLVVRESTVLPRMHAMVEGVDGRGVRCGTEPPRGVYLEGSLDVLSQLFERIITPNQGGAFDGSYAGDPATFEVDPGVSAVRIAMSAPEGFVIETASGAEVRVAGQLGEVFTTGLPRGVSPDVRWNGSSVSVDLGVGPGEQGRWEVRRSGTETALDLYFFVDAEFDVPLAGLDIRSGAPAELTGRIVDTSGEALDLGVFGARDISVLVDGRPATVTFGTDGHFSAAFKVDAFEARVPARLRLDLVTTGGTAIQPIQREVLLPVTLPDEFPTVRIGEFDAVLRPDGGSSRLTVTAVGSAEGPTRVCVRLSELGDGLGELAGVVTVGWDVAGRDLSTCIDLSPGDEVDGLLVAELQDPQVVRRRVTVSIDVELVSAPIDGRAPAATSFIERRTVVVEPEPANPWLVALLLLLGLLVPLLLLILLNRRAGRFRTRDLQGARIPVDLSGGGGGPWRLSRRGGGPLLEVDDLRYLPYPDGPDGQAEWTFLDHGAEGPVSSGETWRADVPRNPFGEVGGRVDAPAGHRIRSNVAPSVVEDGLSAGIDLRPQRSAYLLMKDSALVGAGEEGGVVPATLVVVLGHGGPDAEAVIARHAGLLTDVLVEGDAIDRLVRTAQSADAAGSGSDAPDTAAEDQGAGDWPGEGGASPGSGGGAPIQGWDTL